MLHDSGRADLRLLPPTTTPSSRHRRPLPHRRHRPRPRESAHAVAEAMRLAPTHEPATEILMVNLSGRGDKDMGILARELHLNGANPTHAENRGTR